ncbi:MAG: gliding motility-associated C-terminal domain-containing protein, partial [Bacteroidetes bacterium]|nr:gliding motility-associated C-terminal domain-containing protein [Bacteroidota bacterium]
ATVNVSSAGTYTLTVSNSSNGCSASDEVLVSADSSLPVVDAGASQTIDCVNTSVVLDGSGSSSGASIVYSWANGNGVEIGTGTSVSVSSAGIYTLTVTDTSNNCSASDQVVVISDEEGPTLNPIQTQYLCVGDEDAVINITPPAGNVSVQWTTSTGSIVSGADTWSPTLTTGNYVMSVTDLDNGCESNQAVIVQNATTVSISNEIYECNDNYEAFSAEFTLEGGDGTFSVSATYGNNIALTVNNVSGSTFVVENIPSEELAILYITDGLGCTYEFEATYECIKPLIPPLEIHQVFIPTAFSPNGDGIDDLFRIAGSTMPIMELEVKIYNRWGQKVYESSDVNFAWDGVYNQLLGEVETYVYYMNVKYEDGYEQFTKGNVTLIR